MQRKKIVCSLVLICAAVAFAPAPASGKSYNFGVTQPPPLTPTNISPAAAPVPQEEMAMAESKPSVEVFPLDSAGMPPETEMSSASAPEMPLAPRRYVEPVTPRYVPPATPVSETSVPPAAPTPDLKTHMGIDAIAQLAEYHYNENSPDGQLSGLRYGGGAKGTVTFGNGIFAAAEGRYITGQVDYKGAGTLNNRTDFEWETRGLVGRDFIYDEWSMTPYTGFGYRSLSDDLNNASSSGAHLFRHEDQIYYLPFGIIPRWPTQWGGRVAATLEYDFVLAANETSYLGDAHGGDPTLNTNQRVGQAFRGSLMYETYTWSLGPFANYWNINSSEPSVYHSPSSSCGSATCTLIQPHIHSIEAGMQFQYHFF
jgi:hypothetical protein